MKLYLIITSVAASVSSVSAQSFVFTEADEAAFPSARGNYHGASWGDFDGDGYVDLFAANMDGENLLLRNLGDGSFERIEDSPVVEAGGAACGTWGDYDNDGDLDLFLAYYRNRANRFFQNAGGVFTEVHDSGVTGVDSWSLGAAWADYDLDGYLDLFVVNNSGPNFLYHNEGNGTFARVTDGPVATDVNDPAGCAWADYNGDGYPDLFVSDGNGGAPNVLYKNLDGVSFVRVEGGDLAAGRSASQGGAWGDYDNDGDVDLFVSNRNAPNFLYRNDGGDAFTKMDLGAVTQTATNSNGATWADLNNDGFIDLVVSNWSGDEDEVYLNMGGGVFDKMDSGALESGSAGCAVADVDGDGFQDILFAKLGNSDCQLLRNGGNSNNWLQVSALGQFGVPTAGTVVNVSAWIEGALVEMNRVIDSNHGFLSADSPLLHFGLGSASVVNSLSVQWPSGATASYENVSPNDLIVLREPLGSRPVLEILPIANLFTNQVEVHIRTSISIGEIRYTFDGSDPTNNSILYGVPFVLNEGALIKARVYVNGFPVSEIVSSSYARVYAIDDGIPASWRQEHFGDGYLTDPRVSADADPDLDGSYNLQEFLNGSDPLDPSSGFAVGIRMVPSVSWASVPGTRYRVLRRDDVHSNEPFVVLGEVVAEGDVSSYADQGADGDRAFYAVEVID